MLLAGSELQDIEEPNSVKGPAALEFLSILCSVSGTGIDEHGFAGGGRACHAIHNRVGQTPSQWPAAADVLVSRSSGRRIQALRDHHSRLCKDLLSGKAGILHLVICWQRVTASQMWPCCCWLTSCATIAISLDRCSHILLHGLHSKIVSRICLSQGTKLMTPEKARGVWAIYVWCRRTDELVDGPNASRMNPRVSAA